MPPPRVKPAMPVVETRPAGRRQTVGLRGPVEVSPGRARLGVGHPRRRVDRDPAPAREVDRDAAVAESVTGHVVSAAANGERQRGAPRRLDRAAHVVVRLDLDYGRRPPVDHAVEERSRGVVVGTVGKKDAALDRPPEFVGKVAGQATLVCAHVSLPLGIVSCCATRFVRPPALFAARREPSGVTLGVAGHMLAKHDPAARHRPAQPDLPRAHACRGPRAARAAHQPGRDRLVRHAHGALAAQPPRCPREWFAADRPRTLRLRHRSRQSRRSRAPSRPSLGTAGTSRPPPRWAPCCTSRTPTTSSRPGRATRPSSRPCSARSPTSRSCSARSACASRWRTCPGWAPRISRRPATSARRARLGARLRSRRHQRHARRLSRPSRDARPAHVHLHDNFRAADADDPHRPLGEGVVDAAAVLASLAPPARRSSSSTWTSRRPSPASPTSRRRGWRRRRSTGLGEPAAEARPLACHGRVDMVAP